MDFCIGNLKGTTSTSDFIEYIAATIRAEGYTCSVNTPYSGGEINRRYGTRKREAAILNDQEQNSLDQLLRVAEKMESRLATLEKILDAEQPKWKERV